MYLVSDPDIVLFNRRQPRWQTAACSFWLLIFSAKALFDLCMLVTYLICVRTMESTQLLFGQIHTVLVYTKLAFRVLPWWSECLEYTMEFFQSHMTVYELCLALELVSSFLVTIIFLIMRRTLSSDASRRSPVFPALFQRNHLTNPFHYLLAVVVVAEAAAVSLFYHESASIWLRIPLFWIIPLTAYVSMINGNELHDNRQVICYPAVQHPGWTVIDDVKPGTVKLSQIA